LLILTVSGRNCQS